MIFRNGDDLTALVVILGLLFRGFGDHKVSHQQLHCHSRIFGRICVRLLGGLRCLRLFFSASSLCLLSFSAANVFPSCKACAESKHKRSKIYIHPNPQRLAFYCIRGNVSEKMNHFKIKQARLSNQGSGLSNFLFAFHRSCVSNSSSHGAQPGLQIRIFEKLVRHVHRVLFHVELVSHLFHQPRFCHQDAGFYISSQMLI